MLLFIGNFRKIVKFFKHSSKHKKGMLNQKQIFENLMRKKNENLFEINPLRVCFSLMSFIYLGTK